MNPATISALAALAGAIIGGLTSFATSWFTQQTQIRNAGREARTAKLEALYNEYISLAAGLYADALTHQMEELSKMVPLYALGSRMRLVSARAVPTRPFASTTPSCRPTSTQTAAFRRRGNWSGRAR